MADLLKFTTNVVKTTVAHSGKVIEPRADIGFNICFPYDPMLIDVVKHTLPRKASWDPQNKVWWVGEDPLSVQSVDILCEKHGFALLPHAKERMQRASSREVSHGVILRNPLQPLKSQLVRPLLPHQHPGVQFIMENKRVLVADGVGLGKSTEAIVAVEEMQAYPCVITCISITKQQWKAEIEKQLGPGKRKVIILSGTKAEPIPTDAHFIILNDDILHAWTGQLLALQPKAVIPDETHRFKVHTRRRSKALRNLMQTVPVRVALTATPMTNGIPTELASLLILIGRIDDVGGYHRLVDRFGIWERGPWGAKCVGTQHGEELNALLLQQGVMCRRTKEMIGSTLPPITSTTIEVDITTRAEYRQAEADIRKWILERIAERKKEQKHLTAADRAEALVRLTTLRRIAGIGKVDATVQWAREVLETEPVLIYAHHKEVARAVAAELGKEFPTAVVDGDTSEKHRLEYVANFGTSIKALIATIDAAGTGLDGLQKHASIMAFVELPWTPGRLTQAMGRLDRTGQTKPVSAYFMLGTDTLDLTTVYPTIARKQLASDAVLDGKPVPNDDDPSVLNAVLTRFGGS